MVAPIPLEAAVGHWRSLRGRGKDAEAASVELVKSGEVKSGDTHNTFESRCGEVGLRYWVGLCRAAVAGVVHD